MKFAKGATFHPQVRQVSKEGARTRVIDFPGGDRAIKTIEFKYKNLPGGATC